jgi:hypothetical protein
MSVRFGQKIKIKSTAPLFAGHVGHVAYIGTDGISVYLADVDFDDPIPLNNEEYDICEEG